MAQSTRTEIKQYQGTNKLFKDACTLASTPSTKRQWAKFQQGRCKAWDKRHEAQALQNPASEVA